MQINWEKKKINKKVMKCKLIKIRINKFMKGEQINK